MAELITVKATDPNRVGLWEIHADHPDGEVFVAGDNEVKVARTVEVAKRLKDGTLVEVSKAEKAKPAAAVHVENIGRTSKEK